MEDRDKNIINITEKNQPWFNVHGLLVLDPIINFPLVRTRKLQGLWTVVPLT